MLREISQSVQLSIYYLFIILNDFEVIIAT